MLLIAAYTTGEGMVRRKIMPREGEFSPPKLVIVWRPQAPQAPELKVLTTRTDWLKEAEAFQALSKTRAP